MTKSALPSPHRHALALTKAVVGGNYESVGKRTWVESGHETLGRVDVLLRTDETDNFDPRYGFDFPLPKGTQPDTRIILRINKNGKLTGALAITIEAYAANCARHMRYDTRRGKLWWRPKYSELRLNSDFVDVTADFQAAEAALIHMT